LRLLPLLKSDHSKSTPSSNGDLFSPRLRERKLKRARSSRYTNHHPSGQYKSSLDHIRGCRHSRCPENGLHRMMYSAIMDNHRTRRMSHGTVHRYTLLAAGKLSISMARRCQYRSQGLLIHALADAQPTSVPQHELEAGVRCSGSSLTSAKFAAPRSIPCLRNVRSVACLELALPPVKLTLLYRCAANSESKYRCAPPPRSSSPETPLLHILSS